MRKRIVVAVVLTVLMAASAYAQTTDFFELVKAGTPKQIQAAIDQGSGDINARDTHGNTPLMWAARDTYNPEVITVLLKAGADAKAKNKAGETAFDKAKYNENLKGTEALRMLEEASK